MARRSGSLSHQHGGGDARHAPADAAQSDERLGLIQPSRTIGSMRLYSRDELERLRLIKRLVDELGINLAGVQRLLSIAEVVHRIQPLMDENALEHRRRPAAAVVGDTAIERDGRTLRRALTRPALRYVWNSKTITPRSA